MSFMVDSDISSSAPAHNPSAHLQEMSAALDAGDIKQATRLKNSFTKQPLSTYAKKLQAEFHLLDEKLRKLEDRQYSVTNSKRQELCEKMESLQLHNDIHPEEKAKAIKELRDCWRQLGPSNSGEGQRLWQRFKQAGDVAFSVCSEHFDNKRESGDQNLRERIKICDSLTLFYAETPWQDVNWKAVERIIKKAKSEWKRFNDVPHQHYQEIQDRFQGSLLPIQSKLAEERERNHQLKRNLIGEIWHLLDSNNTTVSLTQSTKRIQSAWKEIGITDRGTDQKLWREFRSVCDQVFRLRDDEKASRKALEAEQARKAELAQEARAQKSAQKIENSECILDELRRKAALCNLLENGGDINDIKNQWDGSVDLPQKLAEIINSRFQRAQSGDIQYAASSLAEDMCVRMEMLANISSPESSRGIRMKLQVERLDQQLSKGIKDDRSAGEQLSELLERWYCMGPVQQGQGELEKRFMKAELAIKNASQP
jgi:hypothetical protein